MGSSVRYGWIQPACACLSPQAVAKGQAPGESSPCPVGGARAFGKILERSSCGWCRRGEFLPGSPESLGVVQGVVQCSQHRPKQQLVVLCVKALLAPRYRDSQGTEYVSKCSDHGETGQVRLWLGSLHCTDAVSPSQILCYSSHTVGEGRTAYVLPSAAQGFRRTSSISELQNILLSLLSSCKRHVLTFCPFSFQPTTQQQHVYGPSSDRTVLLVPNVPFSVSSNLLLGLEMPSIHAINSYLAK